MSAVSTRPRELRRLARGVAANVLRNHFRRTAAADALGRWWPPLGWGRRRGPGDRAERVAAHSPPCRSDIGRAAGQVPGPARSVADIAAAGGETAKAVESLLTRARQAFRDAYGSED